jgi:mono/diheme cytochrome c family protein
VNKLALIAGGSTVVYGCLAWMMGVLPGIELSRVPAGPGVKPLTALEAQGREVYVSSGCSYSTQQVRPLNEDKVFGRPSAAGAEAATGPEQAMAGTTGPKTTPGATSSAGATPPTGGYDAAKGAALYTANCAACHQASGEGLPGAFPSLKDDAVVNKDDPTKHIQVVLNGLHDARVSGVVYGSAMPPFAGTLGDAEVADIIDYERSSWGNHGKPIVAAQVATERAKTK